MLPEPEANSQVDWTYDPNEPRYCICNQVTEAGATAGAAGGAGPPAAGRRRPPSHVVEVELLSLLYVAPDL